MNILILAPQPFYQQRGTPIAVKMLAEELAGLGHRIDLLVYREGEDIEIPGVTLHRIPRVPLVNRVPPGPSWKKVPCDLAMFWSALRLIRSRRIQLVHAVEESAFLAIALKILFRVQYVYDMDSSLAEQTTEKWHLPRPVSSVLEGLENVAIRQSVGVLAVCQALETKARACAPAKLVQRLEDVTMLTECATGPDLRKEFGITGPLLLYVGNLERYQGIDLLLEGFAAAGCGGSGARLVIIGGTETHLQHYRSRAAALGITASTHFTGPRPLDMLGWYLRQADVVVSPRIQGNNTPMKIYSYLDSGRPVLATRLPTHTQVLDDEIALLVEPVPTAVGHGIRRLLSEPELAGRLARNARLRVAQEFSPEAYKRKLGAFYGQIDARYGTMSGPRTNCATQPA